MRLKFMALHCRKFHLANEFVARRVLVVDDHKDAADIVAALIRAMGHTVLAVYDGPTALAAAPAFLPELVLIDLVMPGMDGFQVARKLRELDGMNRIKLVALTGFPRDAVLGATEAAGFDGYVGKPALAEELSRILGRAS